MKPERLIGLCTCGDWIYDHSRTKEPGSGREIYVCRNQKGSGFGRRTFESVKGWKA